MRYKEWTDEGLLRQPVFLRFRDDKPADGVRTAGTRDRGRADAADEPERIDPSPVPPSPMPREVPFSNLDKVFWPEEGYTKGDLIEYYRAISPWLLPYLRDRPLVLTRFPDGIDGQVVLPEGCARRSRRTGCAPSGCGARTPQREIDYFVCDDVASLLYIANLGTIPLHIWASRVATLEQPDWCILDLDPKGAPFRDVVTVALARSTRCATRSSCRASSRPAARPGCTC